MKFWDIKYIYIVVHYHHRPSPELFHLPTLWLWIKYTSFYGIPSIFKRYADFRGVHTWRVYFWEFTKYSPWLYLVYFWMFCCIPLVCFFVCRCHIVLFIEDLDYLLIYNRASFLSLIFFCCSSEDVFLQLFLCICPDKRGSFSLAVVDLLSFLLSTYSPLKL